MLESCARLLEDTEGLLTVALSDDHVIENLDVIRGLVTELPSESSNIRGMVTGFFADLYDTTYRQWPQRILDAFYGVLLLFMVRRTLRSILRNSKIGFTAVGHEVNQDYSFETGATCILYQPMLAILESSKVTFSEMLKTADCIKSTMTAVLYQTAYVVHIPDPMNATPLEHILFFFEKEFPSRLASAWKSVESPARQPSEHFAAVDPLTNLDLPG